MDADDWLTGQFEQHRPRLHRLCYRMLGSPAEADDALQGPAERLAFVLHDLFDLPFEQIADLVDRSPAAARQLASRARRRVRGAKVPDAASDRPAQRRVVQAFFAAARSGDLGALVVVLDPEAVLRADGGASRPEVSALLRGAGEVARRAALFNQPGASVTPVLVNGTVGAVVSRDGKPISVMGFAISGARIAEIDILLDPERLRRLDLAGCLLAKAEAGRAVEQLTGDLQMAGVRRRLLDHVQDHHPDVG
jgi:hypothetical protein